MKALMNFLGGLFMLAVLLGLVYWGGMRVLHNREILTRTRAEVIEALTEDYRKCNLQPPDAYLQLPGASMVFGVPDLVEFRDYIYRPRKAGPDERVAKVEGSYNRISGEFKVDIQYFNESGKDFHNKRTLGNNAAASEPVAASEEPAETPAAEEPKKEEPVSRD
jgi:hypothetical protein